LHLRPESSSEVVHSMGSKPMDQYALPRICRESWTSTCGQFSKLFEKSVIKGWIYGGQGSCTSAQRAHGKSYIVWTVNPWTNMHSPVYAESHGPRHVVKTIKCACRPCTGHVVYGDLGNCFQSPIAYPSYPWVWFIRRRAISASPMFSSRPSPLVYAEI